MTQTLLLSVVFELSGELVATFFLEIWRHYIPLHFTRIYCHGFSYFPAWPLDLPLDMKIIRIPWKRPQRIQIRQRFDLPWRINENSERNFERSALSALKNANHFMEMMEIPNHWQEMQGRVVKRWRLLDFWREYFTPEITVSD